MLKMRTIIRSLLPEILLTLFWTLDFIWLYHYENHLWIACYYFISSTFLIWITGFFGLVKLDSRFVSTCYEILKFDREDVYIMKFFTFFSLSNYNFSTRNFHCEFIWHQSVVDRNQSYKCCLLIALRTIDKLYIKSSLR